MISEQIIEKALSKLSELLSELPRDSRGVPICPFCGSGSGSHATSAIKYNENRSSAHPVIYCCKCEGSADAIKLYRLLHSCSFLDAVQALTNYTAEPEAVKAVMLKQAAQAEAQPQNCSRLLAYASRALIELEEGEPGRQYLASRAISLETAKVFRLGYLDKARVISIPTLSPFTYITRAAGAESLQQARYKFHGSRQLTLLKPKELSSKQILAVTEGIFDLLSLWQSLSRRGSWLLPHVAFCSLNSCSGAAQLVDYLSKLEPGLIPSCSVLCLDSDSEGEKTSSKLMERLRSLGNLPQVMRFSRYKDIAQALEAGEERNIFRAFSRAIPDKIRDGLSLSMQPPQGLEPCSQKRK